MGSPSRVETWDVTSAALGTSRLVHVYLPTGYDELPPGRRLPVLYLHDGQHAFRRAGSGPRWCVDDTLDALVADGRVPPLIAVGVENALEQRGSEYSHEVVFAHQPGAGPRGLLYEQFLVEELKPLVDARLPTRPDACGLMGSSMGGLVTYHVSMRRPESFPRAAICSPFLEYVDPLTGQGSPVYRRFDRRGPQRIWLDIGDAEGLIRVRPVEDLRDHLLDDLGYTPDDELAYHLDRGAIHHEDAWRRRARSALLHLFGLRRECAVVSLRLPPAEVVPLDGQLHDLAPEAVHDDGLVHTLLRGESAFVSGRSGRGEDDVVALESRCRVRPVRPGAAAVTVRAPGAGGAGSATTAITVADGLTDLVWLELTVHLPEPGPAPRLVNLSWWPLEVQGPATAHGRWPVPRGVAIDATVYTEEGEAVDGAGEVIGVPVRCDGDQTFEITVAGWRPGLI